MTDFLNKVITVIMIFVLLVLAPLLISYMSTDMVIERAVLNEVNQFLDKVTDRGVLRRKDLDDLYLGVNSHGGIFNVEVERYIRAAYAMDNGVGNKEVRTVYYTNEDVAKLSKNVVNSKDVNLNVGDVIKVKISEFGTSPASKLLWVLTRIDHGKLEAEITGTVR